MSLLLTTAGSIGGGRVDIANANISDIKITPATATASYELTSSGDINHNGVDSGDWIIPKGAAPGSYEVRATVTAGAVTSGTTGSWLALTSSRSWACSTSGGISTATLTIEIRLGTTVLDSATVTLTAESTV